MCSIDYRWQIWQLKWKLFQKKLIIWDVIGVYNYIHLKKKGGGERGGMSFITTVLFKEQVEK